MIFVKKMFSWTIRAFIFKDTLCTACFLFVMCSYLTASDVFGRFTGMKKVEVLDLAHNQIKALSDGTFRHLPNLKELYLNHNNLRHLPKHVFHGLAKLETLTMQSNLLNKWMLQMNIFPNLKYLRLDGNRIRKIRKNDFIGMSSLL